MSADNANTPANGTPAQPDMVPKAEFLKVKGSLETAVKRLTKQNEEMLAQLSATQAEREEREFARSLEGVGDAEQVKVLRTATYKENLELARQKKQLDAERKQLAAEKLAAKKAELAKTYGVPVEELEDADDEVKAELAALKARDRIAAEAAAANPAPGGGTPAAGNTGPASPPVDTGARGGSAGSPKRTATDWLAAGITKGQI